MTVPADWADLRAMEPREQEFCRLVGTTLRRFFLQNSQPPPAEPALTEIASRLWTVVHARGLPPPLAPGALGAPAELPETEISPMAAVILGGGADGLRAEAVRQLLKACLYPEFTVCRESYRAAAPDGACRRQELGRAQRRISGAHCVDCPYWLSHSSETHGALLAAGWHGPKGELQEGLGVFLPEDFRALRRWIRLEARPAGRAVAG